MALSTFGPWPADLHSTPDQQSRIASAKKAATTPLIIDKDAQTGVFPGSGKNPYQTSLSSCTCIDFSRRKLPCKHIYRLAMECGLIEDDFKTGANKNIIKQSQISLEDAVAELENLPDAAQLELKDLLCSAWPSTNGKWSINITPDLLPLKSCSLVHCDPVPSADSLSSWLSSLKKRELIDILNQLQIESPKMTKPDLEIWCKRNVPEIEQMAPSQVRISFVPEFSAASRKVYQYLRRKYDWEYFSVNDYRYPFGSDSVYSRSGSAYWFPDDEITQLLTQYGCNRCLNGYQIEK